MQCSKYVEVFRVNATYRYVEVFRVNATYRYVEVFRLNATYRYVEVFRVNATYKSRADIDGGSAMNSNSAGGSLGIKGCSDTCFSNSCCCFC